MKTFIASLVLATALPLVAVAQTKETKTTWNGHAVTIVTGISRETPLACQQALDRLVAQQPWHDQIACTSSPTRAYSVYCVRDAEACCANQVRIILWRATVRAGQTVTETRTVHLRQSEVNRFLDSEIEIAADQFFSAPVAAR